jgi:ABC-type nitrate/sulfonate/bicarbonate transport system substrate-binding protein
MLRVFTIGIAFMSLQAVAQSPAPAPIRIAIQPGLYSMLATKVASANGYWEMVGLKPTFFTYPAGIPQLKGSADWDVGIMGATPALIGAKEYDMITIAVTDDQARTNVMMGSKETAAKIKQAGTIASGSKIAVTLNSTADYAVQTCLALWGAGKSKSDMVYTGATQTEAIAAGASGAADLVGLWAPNMYTMQEQHGFVPICSAKDFSPGVFTAVVSKRAYATANPQIVSKFVAVLIRAMNWIKSNPEKAQVLLIESAAKEGITISPKAAKSDFELRPLFDLSEQLELFSATNINSTNAGRLARSFRSIDIFLTEGKTGSRTIKTSAFIDGAYLQRIKTDQELSKFASSK